MTIKYISEKKWKIKKYLNYYYYSDKLLIIKLSVTWNNVNSRFNNFDFYFFPKACFSTLFVLLLFQRLQGPLQNSMRILPITTYNLKLKTNADRYELYVSRTRVNAYVSKGGKIKVQVSKWGKIKV